MDYFALFLFILTATVSPGPNNMMLLTSGLNFGIKPSLPHYLGICTGFPVMVIGIGLGIGLVFKQFPLVQHIFQTLSVLYLFYLAWGIANTNHLSAETKVSKPLSFTQAVLFQWVNPKAWVMATLALSLFVLHPNTPINAGLIALAFMLMAFPSAALWLIFGYHLKRYLKDQKHLKWFNISMALLLIIAIYPAIVDTLNWIFG